MTEQQQRKSMQGDFLAAYWDFIFFIFIEVQLTNKTGIGTILEELRVETVFDVSHVLKATY